MNKTERAACFLAAKSATALTTVDRKVHSRRRKLSVLLIILLAFISAPVVDVLAASVTLEFETQGLDLKTGKVVKIMTIPAQEMGKADFIIAYNADATPHAVLMPRQPGIELVILKDVTLGEVKDDSIDKLSFSAKTIDQPLKQSNTVVLRTTDGSIYKIGDVIESKSSVTFNYEKLQ